MLSTPWPWHAQGSSQRRSCWDACFQRDPWAESPTGKPWTPSTHNPLQQANTLQIWQTTFGAFAPVREAFPAWPPPPWGLLASFSWRARAACFFWTFEPLPICVLEKATQNLRQVYNTMRKKCILKVAGEFQFPLVWSGFSNPISIFWKKGLVHVSMFSRTRTCFKTKFCSNKKSGQQAFKTTTTEAFSFVPWTCR